MNKNLIRNIFLTLITSTLKFLCKCCHPVIANKLDKIARASIIGCLIHHHVKQRKYQSDVGPRFAVSRHSVIQERALGS